MKNELLESIQHLAGAVKRARNEVEYFESKINRITKPLDQDVVQGGIRSDGALWDCLIQARRRHNDLIIELWRRRVAANKIIDKISDPLLSEIIYCRYLTEPQPTFERLADTFHYSERWIRILHNRGLQEFTKVQEKTE